MTVPAARGRSGESRTRAVGAPVHAVRAAIVNGFGFGGQNAVAVFRAYA